MEFNYYRNIAYLQDLFYIFHAHFNSESILESHTKRGIEDEAEHNVAINKRFAPIPEELHIFFTLKSHGRGFMSFVYLSCADYASPQSISFENLLTKLRDVPELLRKLFGFWLMRAESDLLDIKSLSRDIDSSDLDERVKRELYSFAADPERYAELLINTLIEKEKMLSEYYKECEERIISTQAGLDGIAIEELLDHIHLEPQKAVTSLNYSVSLLNRFLIWVCGTGNDNDPMTVLLGAEYKTIIHKKKAPIDIDLPLLGDILSEPNRISILELVREHGEITLKDVERHISCTGSTAHYHVTMMLRAKMLSVRGNGRTLYYRINDEYFREVVAVFARYCEDKN